MTADLNNRVKINYFLGPFWKFARTGDLNNRVILSDFGGVRIVTVDLNNHQKLTIFVVFQHDFCDDRFK